VGRANVILIFQRQRFHNAISQLLDIDFASHPYRRFHMPIYANYLPDEILLEVISYIEAWDVRSKQATLAQFCAVNRYALSSPV
jgi:hypothetical protein